MTIRLHIERVVIDRAAAEGLRAETIQDALAAELGRLLAEAGPESLGASADVPRAQASLARHPAGLAPALASALYGCVAAAGGGGAG
jgi:hypothetical protein